MTNLDTAAAIGELVQARVRYSAYRAENWHHSDPPDPIVVGLNQAIVRLLKTLPDDVVDVSDCFDPLQIVSHLIGPRHKVVLETIRGKSHDQMVMVHDLYHQHGPIPYHHLAEDFD